MKHNLSAMLLWGASLSVALVGCARKSDANSELQKAASALEQPASAQPQGPPPVQAVSTPAPAQEMKQALAAYKSGDFQDAVTRLQQLRATPVMTPQQRMALNDAVAAVMAEIYSLAAKGDARAVQAVRQYEQMQTQGR